MTYSIHTLVNPTGSPHPEIETASRTGFSRFAQEFGLFIAGAALLLGFLSLLSYNMHDPSWSSSGSESDIWNTEFIVFLSVATRLGLDGPRFCRSATTNAIRSDGTGRADFSPGRASAGASLRGQVNGPRWLSTA